MKFLGVILTSARRLIAKARDRNPKQWRYVLTDDLPDPPAAHRVYLVGEDGVLWYAAMLCPCDCGATLHMSLHKEGTPRWKATPHRDGTISLSPSVWRKIGCRSHFIVRNGRIIWC